jgi:hypothetical protein
MKRNEEIAFEKIFRTDISGDADSVYLFDVEMLVAKIVC